MTATPPETRIVNTNRVACDGGGSASGHPRVWLQIPADKGWVECGYCDCKFIHEDFEGKV
ncbi:zinc-finger domain-containing protein [uncultured Sulfitobacter sp.]|uniref:zinc-finger domain-containing protein n=1 Tax=uncultured Sulfitobacter sp. TaxID=191468 RepID=UPI00263A2540|nr:zinc-finger domain-containing protein [uncultured Sulfitobacter sp.]